MDIRRESRIELNTRDTTATASKHHVAASSLTQSSAFIHFAPTYSICLLTKEKCNGHRTSAIKIATQLLGILLDLPIDLIQSACFVQSTCRLDCASATDQI